MTGRVSGKRIAVVGAGSIGEGWGNGKAAAVLYAREGGRVLCIDRDADAAQQTVNLIRSEGGEAYVFVADMTAPKSASGAMAEAQQQLGGLDILHFNLGISSRGGISDTHFEDWRKVFSVNLDAAFHVTQAALPLLERGGGSIIFISTLAALLNGPYPYIAYEVSKAALCRMAKSIAVEYAARGVRVNTVLPGMIDTPHAQAFVAAGMDAATLRANRAAQVPMKRQGTPFDVAEAALFLASDAAGFITGAELCVDGGMGLLMGNAAK
jgi:NAD(P)-dependent dehydrogenase (short-subunit alcohol dehydrogenase family)